MPDVRPSIATPDGGRVRVYRCSGCEVQAVGSHLPLCACGVMVNGGRRPFRCVVVPVEERGPTYPQAVAVAFGGTLLRPDGPPVKRKGTNLL
jgi:hypothetical protein